MGFNLCQEFFWHNPAKMPAPAEWVNVRRIRVKDSVEYIFWLSASAFPKADNSKVLQAYSKDMERLIKAGHQADETPIGPQYQAEVLPRSWRVDSGQHHSHAGTTRATASTSSNRRSWGKKIHPARFPAELPRFFIEFLTEPGDLVLDPFAGSNTTGAVAEQLGRKWIAVEKSRDLRQGFRIAFPVPRKRQWENQGAAVAFRFVR